jgi:uncharacterized protein
VDRVTATSDTGATWSVDVPTTRRERMRGLLGRSDLDPGRALLIRRTGCVHTFGMRFAISVAWLDSGAAVVRVTDMRPRRVSRPRWRPLDALECARGFAPAVGETLRLERG